MNGSLKKGISIIFIVNIINLVFKLLTNFLFPKFLSVDSYAGLKYFQLIISYLGVLHFGFVDGAYLEYGGKKIDANSKVDMGDKAVVLFVIEAAVTVVLLLCGIFSKDFMVIAAAFAVIPTEMVSYYKYICQATGEFAWYGQIMNWSTIILFALNIILLLLRVDNVYFYVVANLISLFVVWVIIQKKFYVAPKREWWSPPHIGRTFITLAGSGVLIMLGNFMVQLLTGMDRWFVKGMLPNADFAQYSFAVSTEAFLLLAISPISITLYNYFCTHSDGASITRLKNIILLFSVVIVACAYPAKWVLEWILPEYKSAGLVMFGLFASQVFNTAISCIYVNLYKVKKMQQVYFKKLVAVIFLGFASNVAIYMIFPQKEAFSFATCISMIIWLLLSEHDFPEARMGKKNMLFLLVESSLFILFGYYLNPFAGLAAYILCTALLSWILLNGATRDVIGYGLKIIQSVKKSNL